MDVGTRQVRLDAGLVRGWAATAVAACAAARERIDAVNVFPVPDGDTGSNVALTVAGGAAALDGLPVAAPWHEAVTAFAHGAARAARGNSGVILSQWLVGLAHGLGAADAAGGAEHVDPDRLACALTAAADAAVTAVPDPQEGTVLTVARDVARTVRAGRTAAGAAADLLAQAVDAARDDLRRTSAGHDVLRAARVVDAGACGLLVVLDALVAALRGRDASAVDLAWLPQVGPDVLAGCASGSGGAFEVMMLVRDVAGARLATALQAVGDAVAVADAGGLLHAHVHTDRPAAALATVAAAARSQVVVRRIEEPPPTARGLVVLTPSPGLAAWFATCGAVTLVGDAPGVDEVVRAARDTRTGRAVVVDAGTGAPVPGDLDVVAATGDGPAVVACLALVADDAADPEAAHAALHRLAAATTDAHEAVPGLVARLLAAVPGAQAVTLVHGEDVDDRAVVDVAVAVAGAHRDLEVVVAGPARGDAWWVGVD